MTYFDLKYPSGTNGWAATLGQTPEQQFDPETGKEDFTEQRKVSSYLEAWRAMENWTPAQICLHFEARGRKLSKVDRIFHGMVGPFISENAAEKMRPLLERDGHILPLEVMNSDEKFYLWWVPWVEGSVDLARSEKFPNGKTVKKYAFNDKKVDGLTAFRPHYVGMYNPDAQGQVLVSDEFRAKWLDADLTGIEFKPT
jgi:hypothetical protein